MASDDNAEIFEAATNEIRNGSTLEKRNKETSEEGFKMNILKMNKINEKTFAGN